MANANNFWGGFDTPGFSSDVINPQARPKAAQQPQRKGVTKFLPAIGATAAGLAAAPFTGGLSLVGTLATLGAAGAVGTAYGELGAEKMNHENISGKNIAKQSAIGGALGAVPLGGFARAAKTGIQAAKPGAEEASALFAKGLKGNMALHGQQLEARSGGYAVNSRIPGAANLDLGASQNIGNILKNEGIKAGNPLNRLNMVEGKLSGYGSQIDQIVAKNDVAVSKTMRQQIANNYLKDMRSRIGNTPDVMRKAENLASNFVKNGGNKASKIIGQKRELDKNLINYIKNPDSALAGEQRAVVPFRQALKEETNKMVKGIKPLNDKYHDLSSAQAFLVKGAGELNNARGGIVPRVLDSGLAKTAESKLGRALESIGGQGAAGAGKQNLTRTVGTEGAKQAIGQSVLGGNIGDNSPDGDLGMTDALQQPDQQSPDATAQAPQDANPYPLQNALMDIQRDPKNANTYLSIYKTSEASTAPAKTNAAQQKNDLDLSIAHSGLSSIAQAYQFAGGGKGAPGIATHIPIAGQYLAPKAAAYNQTKIEVATQLAKALTGSSRPAESVIMYYLHSLPNVEDRPTVAQDKLKILNNELGNRTKSSQAVFGGGSSPYGNDDLTSTLLQMQGAQ
jgi:hypothetical protein